MALNPIEASGDRPPSHRPEIDSLRAIAVLSVVVFHAGLGAPGGYVGVDVFLVISGYLITQLIARDIEAGHFSLARFWVRRIRRIAPALVVLLVCVMSTGVVLLLPSDLAELGESAVPQTLLVTNVQFWRDVGCFARPAETKALLHTWSLALGDQFYLGFPVFMGYLGRVRILSVASALGTLSFALGAYATAHYPSAASILLPARAWELCVGSEIALLPRRTLPRLADECLAAMGLAFIVSAFRLYDRGTPFSRFRGRASGAGAAMVIWATERQRTWVGSGLAIKPLVFVGLISYSLWHWPLIAFTRYVIDHDQRNTHEAWRRLEELTDRGARDALRTTLLLRGDEQGRMARSMWDLIDEALFTVSRKQSPSKPPNTAEETGPIGHTVGQLKGCRGA